MNHNNTNVLKNEKSKIVTFTQHPHNNFKLKKYTPNYNEHEHTKRHNQLNYNNHITISYFILKKPQKLSQKFALNENH